jgi:ParB family chromosome partitioning protein
MSVHKIVLSVSRDIPFNKLILSQFNVRRVIAGVSIGDLAEDIAHRGLLQSLNVRPVLDADGHETGMFEVPAGGRRYRALELLVKQKRLVKSAPVPCLVKSATDAVSAEEDSLAENVQRAPLHPLDQFRAFQALRDRGLGDDEIAARFFISPTVVRQRLKLAAVSPRLLELFARDEISLEQLMAFAITNDHARQEQVWESLVNAHNQEPYFIRRQLTEGAVRASDKRAQFVGVDTYEAAGGTVTRDLFEEDDGGWLQDPALLDRLVTEKLRCEAVKLGEEGWKWINVAADFPYGHTAGLRRIDGEITLLSGEEQAAYDALRTEYQRLEEEYAEADDLPEAIDQRLAEIETACAAFEDRPVIFDAQEVTRAGAFVSIGADGDLHIERGFVRREDEPQIERAPNEPSVDGIDRSNAGAIITVGTPESAEMPEEDGNVRPLSDRLVTELTVHRTLALRDALGTVPDIAAVAVLHALSLYVFYRSGTTNTCLEIMATSARFDAQAPGLNLCASAKSIGQRHDAWRNRLPKESADLWDALTALGLDDRAALLAHCASLTVNIVKEPSGHRSTALAHGEVLALSLGLDMVAAGWKPTVDNYLGRVPKTRILDAVREAKGEASVQLIDHLKKPEMAREAERLLDGAGWLPEPLRNAESQDGDAEGDGANEALPEFLADDAAADDRAENPEPAAIAAE